MRTFIALALVAGATLPAQNIVSPAHFRNADGNTYIAEPFGTTASPYRYLQVHADMAGKPGQINALRVRRHGGSTTSWASFQIFCDVWMSTATTTPQAMNSTFDSNHGMDKTKVLNFGQVVFPATVHDTLPAPFDYKIPLATPFNFGGAGPLCWESTVQVRQNNFTVYFDAVSGANTNPYPTIRNLGTGCKVGGFTSGLYMNGSSSINWNTKAGNFSYNGGRAPKNSLAFILVGISRTSYGGIPLPFELPSTNGAASGVCNLYVAPILTLPSFTDASGNFTLNLGTNLAPEMNGVSIFGQALAPDAAANPLGLGSSNLVEHHILSPWTAVPVGRVYASNLGATGSVSNTNGLVVRFDI